MSQKNENQAISRRRFLTVLGVTSLTSGVAGAGFTLRQMGKNSVSISTEATYQPAQFDAPIQPTVETVVQNPATLALDQERLAQVSIEKVQLQTEVDSLKQQLESTESVLEEKLTYIRELETKLEATTKRRSAALGLVALYEQLEDVDITATFQTGLKTVGDAWNEFVDDLPAASEGLVQASALITEFDGQIPLFQSARSWLSVRLELLRRDHNVLHEVLKGWFTDPIGPVLEMLGKWFDDVRKWVPSRFLDTANLVIDSLVTMVSGVPVTVDGAESNLANVLDGWFGDDDDDVERNPIIRTQLFRPLKDQALPNALTMLQKTRIAKQKYEADLVTQVVETLNRRQLVESQIREYRERNDLIRLEI
ncbi:MAG: hypothetical protein ACI9EW_002084 [Cellvibrionaceae bacterium]|jgi:hypothetical protein